MIINNNIQRQSCPICTSSQIYSTGVISYPEPVLFSTQAVKFKVDPQLYTCKMCRSKFISHVVSKDILRGLYRESNSNEKWHPFDFETEKPARMVEELRSLLGCGKYLLDVGCNTGDFLDFAKKQGCQTFGVEYSKNCLEILGKKGHYAFNSEDEITGTYDIITAFDVIEHTYDIPSFFEFYKTKLKPDGFFILLTGDISCTSAIISGRKWWYFNLPEHIVFPSKRFFHSQRYFNLNKIISTYQSNYFDFPLLSRFKIILNRLIQTGQYNGFPLISTDHILVVMQKYETDSVNPESFPELEQRANTCE